MCLYIACAVGKGHGFNPSPNPPTPSSLFFFIDVILAFCTSLNSTLRSPVSFCKFKTHALSLYLYECCECECMCDWNISYAL